MSHLGRTGAWIGVGTAIGAALFILTREPVWIGVGVAVGAGLIGENPKADIQIKKIRINSALQVRHQESDTQSQRAISRRSRRCYKIGFYGTSLPLSALPTVTAGIPKISRDWLPCTL